jgi:outer membrane protein TolC
MIRFIFEKKTGHKSRSAGFSRSRTAGKFLIILVPVAAGWICFSCVPGLPNVQNVPATSSGPGIPWTPPASVSDKPPARQITAIPIEQVLGKFSKLTLAMAVDIALQNNPATRAAWADARAAAAGYGSAQGAWYPTAGLSGNFSRYIGLPVINDSEVQPADPVTEYAVTASLSYLLFDFGGRSASVELSRQALLAADWTHNAVIQNTVLQVETAFFNYAGALAMLDANKTSLSEAEANLAAAKERRRLGVATKADELQAQTAYSEVKLAVLETEGQVRTFKGALAVAMGFSADLLNEFVIETPEFPGNSLSTTVDKLIDQALASRPDLQAARAQVLESEAKVTQARSRMLPSLSAGGSLSRIWLKDVPGYNDIYSLALTLHIPVFTGFSPEYDLIKAKEEADAARERARSFEQTVVFQVFSAHSAFLTANERIITTDDLVASARESEEVALGRYKEGVGNILDLLSAQRVLANARAVQINARLDWFISLAQLAHDVGILGVHGDNPLAPQTISPR